MDLLRRLRLEVLLSQWCAVEARCIECSVKRIRSNMIGEVPVEPEAVAATVLKGAPKPRKQPTAVTISSFMDEDGVEEHIKKEVQAALSKTLINDRIITQVGVYVEHFFLPCFGIIIKSKFPVWRER